MKSIIKPCLLQVWILVFSIIHAMHDTNRTYVTLDERIEIYRKFLSSINISTTTLQEQHNNVTKLVFSMDGVFLASHTWDGNIKIWNVNTGCLHGSIDAHEVTALAFSPDGKILASAGVSENTIKIWDITSGNLLYKLEGHTDFINVLTFSPNGKILASGSMDATIKWWNVDENRILCTLTGHTSCITAIRFFDDMVLISASTDQMVKTWKMLDVEFEKFIVNSYKMDSSHTTAITFEDVPWGKRIFIAGNCFFKDTSICDILIKKMMLDSNNPWNTMLKLPQDFDINSFLPVCLSSNGQFAIAGFSNGRTVIFHVLYEQILYEFTQQEGCPTALCLSPNDKWLAVGMSDGTVKIWHIDNLIELAKTINTMSFDQLRFLHKIGMVTQEAVNDLVKDSECQQAYLSLPLSIKKRIDQIIGPELFNNNSGNNGYKIIKWLW